MLQCLNFVINKNNPHNLEFNLQFVMLLGESKKNVKKSSNIIIIIIININLKKYLFRILIAYINININIQFYIHTQHFAFKINQ